jgi:folate-dependent phosphoribosylglycinamide formyltransferase PurN
VVVLCADGLLHRHTCATLLRAGVHVVGIVTCARSGLRARATFLTKWARRHGLARTSGQVLGRLYDRARNGRRDARALERLVDDQANRAAIAAAGVSMVRTDSYSRTSTLEAIRRLDPDVFVVHTKYIVGAAVRRLAPVAVIGGHPGITPYYRGAYAPFWAVRHRRPEMVGFTVFLLDDGIDTGPILHQDTVSVVAGEDSHLTLAWKGMIRLSEVQACCVRQLDAGECLALRSIREVPADSYFGPPTLKEFLQYRRVQQLVR